MNMCTLNEINEMCALTQARGIQNFVALTWIAFRCEELSRSPKRKRGRWRSIRFAVALASASGSGLRVHRSWARVELELARPLRLSWSYSLDGRSDEDARLLWLSTPVILQNMGQEHDDFTEPGPVPFWERSGSPATRKQP